MPDSDGDARLAELVDSGMSSAARATIVTPLENGVVRWVRHHADTAVDEERNHLVGVGIVVGVHRRRVTRNRSVASIPFERFISLDFGEPRARVVGLVDVKI